MRSPLVFVENQFKRRFEWRSGQVWSWIRRPAIIRFYKWTLVFGHCDHQISWWLELVWSGGLGGVGLWTTLVRNIMRFQLKHSLPKYQFKNYAFLKKSTIATLLLWIVMGLAIIPFFSNNFNLFWVGISDLYWKVVRFYCN